MIEGQEHSEPIPVGLTRAITKLVIVTLMAATLVLASEIVLILFLGVLFGVFLSRLTAWLETKTPIGHGGSLAVVVSTLLLLFSGGIAFFFVQINEQVEQANDKLDQGVAELRRVIAKYPAVESTVSSIPLLSRSLVPREAGEKQAAGGQDDSSDSEGGSAEMNKAPIELNSVPEPVRKAAGTIGQLFRSTFGLVVNSLLIFFVGLFIATSPDTYRAGLIKLVPPPRRGRAGEVLSATEDVLWRWLIGRFGSMLITGFGAFVLLALIGVPMAGTLGILTGLLTFVPNIGAAVSLMLSLLIALPQGLGTAAMVLLAYLVLQLVESYVITPLIQQRQVSLPPATLIAFQAVMGVIFGFIGAAVASPLLAVLKTVVEMLYIEDWLEAS